MAIRPVKPPAIHAYSRTMSYRFFRAEKVLSIRPSGPSWWPYGRGAFSRSPPNRSGIERRRKPDLSFPRRRRRPTTTEPDGKWRKKILAKIIRRRNPIVAITADRTASNLRGKKRTSDRSKRITLLYYYALTAPEISQHYFRFPRRCKCAIVITRCTYTHARAHIFRWRPSVNFRSSPVVHLYSLVENYYNWATRLLPRVRSLCVQDTIVEDTLKCERVKKK